MAGSMFIKIDGIEGESGFKGHEKEIDVLSWSWGVQQPSSSVRGGGLGAATANVSDFTFTHKVDRASPNLLQQGFFGHHIPAVQFTQRKAGGDESLPFLKIKLTDVIITGVNPGGQENGEALETVSLRFDKVETEYQEQDKTGKAKGGPVKMVIDIHKHSK